MTENLKKFLELVSANPEAVEKMNKASAEEIIAMAKDMGIALTAADFEKPAMQTLEDDELDAVAGGHPCFCALGGGGKATEAGEDTCACVAVGYGHSSKGTRCVCTVSGTGGL